MTSITISSDLESICPEIASKIAAALDIEFLGPRMLERVAADRSVDASDLAAVLDPGAYHRIGWKKRRLFLAYIQNATLETLAERGAVCAGLGTHLHVKNVSHVLMVHLLFGTQYRLDALVTERKVTERRAQKLLQQEQDLRSRWSRECFGIDESDPSIYDMVINASKIDIDKLVQIITDMAGYRKFQPMTYSRLCLNNLLLGSRVRAALFRDHPKAQVEVDGDRVIVRVQALWGKEAIVASIKETVGKMEGVGLVEAHVERTLALPFRAAGPGGA